MAASKPTSWLSRPPAVLRHSARTWGPYRTIWAVALSTRELLPPGLTPLGPRSTSELANRQYPSRGPSIGRRSTPTGSFPEGSPSSNFGENQLSRRSLGISPLAPTLPSSFQRPWVRPSRWSYPPFSLAGASSRRFGSAQTDSRRGRLACAAAPDLPVLNLARLRHSPVHSSRGTPSSRPGGRDSDGLSAHGFRLSFTPLPGGFSPFPHGTLRYRCPRVPLSWVVGHPASRPRSRGGRYSGSTAQGPPLRVRGSYPRRRRFPPASARGGHA